MTSQAGAQPNTYDETIARLKREIETHAVSLKSNPLWPEIEKAYHALTAIEEMAGTRRTHFEELLGLAPAKPVQDHAGPDRSLELALEGQQETEAAAEKEKGS